MKKTLLALTLVAGLISFAGNAKAAVLTTYELQGSASGSLNSVSFSNRMFDILMQADSGTVTFRNNNEYDVLGNISISISGFSTVNVNGYVKQLVSSATQSWFSFQAGTLDTGSGIINGINGNGTNNYLNQNYTANLGYGGNFPSGVNTSGGTLFTSGAYATNFTVSVQSVPEPSTYALFGIGALALVVAYRRKIV